VPRVEVTRRFSAPPQVVWDVYTDHAGWQRWAGVGSSRLEREGLPERDGVGAVRSLGFGPLRAVEEVLEFEPPKRMVYRVVRGGLPLRDHLGEVRFEPDGDGTRVVWTCRFESRVPGLGWLLERMVTRVFRTALEGLAARGLPGSAAPRAS
jgi:uncharacterized protein YndB with AHSA1/START domain